MQDGLRERTYPHSQQLGGHEGRRSWHRRACSRQSVYLLISLAHYLPQADAVSHSLGVPVLRHRSLKPSYKCIRDIQAYFASLTPPVQLDEVAVVGDRVFTDVIMANRMRGRSVSVRTGEEAGSFAVLPLAIHTTGLWKRESRTVRWAENVMVRMVERWAVDEESAKAKRDLAARFTHPSSA